MEVMNLYTFIIIQEIIIIEAFYSFLDNIEQLCYYTLSTSLHSIVKREDSPALRYLIYKVDYDLDDIKLKEEEKIMLKKFQFLDHNTIREIYHYPIINSKIQYFDKDHIDIAIQVVKNFKHLTYYHFIQKY